MTACEHRRRLSAYHDGELSPEEARALEAHVDRCATCARELERLRALSRRLASATRPTIPTAALARLHRRVGRPGVPVLLRMVRTLTAAAAAVLVICSLSLWQAGALRDARPEPIAAWETAALTLPVQGPTEVSERLLPQWVVVDLAQESGHD